MKSNQQNQSFQTLNSFFPPNLLEVDQLLPSNENDIALWIDSTLAPERQTSSYSANEIALSTKSAQDPKTFTISESKKKEVIPKKAVKLFSDKELRNLVNAGDKITKDHIHYFVLPNVFENDQGDLEKQVYIDDNIFVSGNRKKSREPKNENSIVLNLKLLDSSGSVLDFCETCAKKSNKKLVPVRNAERRNKDIIVTASVTCSGNPAKSSRFLQVHFDITYKDKQFYEADSSYFCLYHHRRKRNRNSLDPEELEITQQNLVSQHKLLRPTSNFDVEGQLTVLMAKELFPHLLDVVLADISSVYFNEAMLHTTMRDMDIFLRKHPIVKMPYVFRIAEFILNMNGVSYSTFEPILIFGTDKVIQEKATSFHFNRSAQISRHFLTSNNANEVRDWLDIQQFVWEFLYDAKNGRQFCNCESCKISHLQIIARCAVHRGIPISEITRSLLEMGIFENEKEVSIVYNSNRAPYFSWSLYLARTNIGEFSREWYPAEHLRNAAKEGIKCISSPSSEDAQLVFLGREEFQVWKLLEEFTPVFENLLSYCTSLSVNKKKTEPPNQQNAQVNPDQFRLQSFSKFEPTNAPSNQPRIPQSEPSDNGAFRNSVALANLVLQNEQLLALLRNPSFG